MVSGSSKGTQDKYYSDGYWYKINSKGYEGLSEYLVSKLLSCTDIDNYVEYEKCTINGRNGCRSKNFLGPDESFMSFQRLFDIYHGGNLSEVIIPLNDVSERVSFVKDFIYDSVGFDVSDYLSKILTLDMVTLNTDRHFNNLGIIINSKTGKCKEAPIFDNGAALMSNFSQFEPDLSLEENLNRAYAMPFSSNFELQVMECGVGITINYEKLDRILKSEPDSRALDVLKYQTNRYKSLFLEHDLTTEIDHDDYDIDNSDDFEER